MPRFNIEHNGKWACFSSISEGFITGFMDKSEYENWRLQEYGKRDYKSVEQCNQMDLKAAVCSIYLNRTREETVNCLLEIGLSETECEQIVSGIETK